MIKKFNDFDQTKGYTDSAQLPRGGYVCKIVGAKPMDGGYGQSIKIAFDIIEGDYKDYYQKKYAANNSEDKKWPGTFLLNVPSDDGSERDGWTKRRFRTFTDALEDSNLGYHFDWDETKFKNKLIGFVFNYREWEASDGKVVLIPNPANVTSVDNIRKENYKIPADRMLKGRKATAPASSPADPMGFMAVPEGSEEEIPF